MHVRVPERRAGVVVADDLVVGPTVEGVAVGAVLRQADAVAPAVTCEEDRGQRLCLLGAVRGRAMRPHLVRVAGRGASCKP